MQFNMKIIIITRAVLNKKKKQKNKKTKKKHKKQKNKKKKQKKKQKKKNKNTKKKHTQKTQKKTNKKKQQHMFLPSCHSHIENLSKLIVYHYCTPIHRGDTGVANDFLWKLFQDHTLFHEKFNLHPEF